MKTTTNYKKEVTELLNILCTDYDLTDKQADFLDSIKSKKENTAEDVTALKALEDELLNGSTDEILDVDTKKFVWKKSVEYKDYKILTAKDANFETLKKSDIIAYRMDETVIKNLLKNGIEYSDNVTFDNAQFIDGIDYCRIKAINKNSITVESIQNSGAITYLDIADFEKCIDNVNVAFRVLTKIA